MKCGQRFNEDEVQMKIKSALSAADVPEGYNKGEVSLYFVKNLVIKNDKFHITTRKLESG